MTNWIVGDIHGCAHELEALVRRLQIGPEDHLISVGDLFHRGPDPIGVLEILTAVRAEFILGNHELAVLNRCGLAPRGPDAASRPTERTQFPEIDAADLAGDGGEPWHGDVGRGADVLRYLQRHAGYFIESHDLAGSPSTARGDEWGVVHAGITDETLAQNSIATLTSLRRTGARGRPWWYESYRGPKLILFGHTPSRVPRSWHIGEKLVALGLDTGCVYGGRLTAYAPELDELVSVSARREYARTS